MKVGVIVPIAEDEETGQPPSYSQLRDLALQAEAADFDSLWIPDHFLYRFPDRPTFGIWESWTMLTALAEATDRVELGTLVMCVPFRNPALLTKMAITLDEVSGGRLILGLGAGWHEPEFEAFGVPFERLASQFEEGLQIIAPLLREGKVDFHGKYSSAPDCEMPPRGPRPAGPPVLVASRGKRMLRLTAQYADQWNAAWFGHPTLYPEKHAELVDACQQVGRDPSSIAVTVGVVVIYPEHLTPYQTKLLPDSYNDPDHALRGEPEDIAAGLAEYADLDVDHLICNVIPSTPETLEELGKALHLLKG